MTETQPINWATPFREAMSTKKDHQAIGMTEKIAVPPIDQKKLSEIIDIPFDRTPLSANEFHNLSLKALDFAVQNTPLYSGITAEDFYQANGKDISVAQKSAEEFTKILTSIISNDIQDLNLPKPVSEFLSNIETQPTAYDIRRGVERGILTAKQCEACEQVDPIIGAQFHIASAIMNRLYGESPLTSFWNETYGENSFNDINNPSTVGLVDLLIIAVRDNKEKFPTLDKFCGSSLKSGTFEGTYYDMVDTPVYQNQ